MIGAMPATVQPDASPPPLGIPSLRDGQQLSREAFHRLYESAPPGARAELIGGTVRMGMPTGAVHSSLHSILSGWFVLYQAAVGGVRSHVTPTLLLGAASEPEPDLVLYRTPAAGGRVRASGTYLEGPPELVVEIAATTEATDLGVKFRDYAAALVDEYLVVLPQARRVRWFVREQGSLVEMDPDPDGIHRSRVFPGIRLDPEALFDEDLPRLLATLQEGLSAAQ